MQKKEEHHYELTAGLLILIIGAIAFTTALAGTITGEAISEFKELKTHHFTGQQTLQIRSFSLSRLFTSQTPKNSLLLTRGIDIPSLEQQNTQAFLAVDTYRQRVSDKIRLERQKGRTAEQLTGQEFTTPLFTQAWQNYLTAETNLDQSLAQAWTTLQRPTLTTVSTLSSEPLQLGALTFERELRKKLGPGFSSGIMNLPRSCQRDLFKDKVFFNFIKSTTSPSTLNSQAYPGLESAKLMAIHSACLNTIDTMILEKALYESTQTVLAKYDTAGKPEMKPLFLRSVLPLFVLFYDTTKSQGHTSEIYKILKENEASLKQTLQQRGWPTSSLYLYNRGDGSLLTLPICSTTECIDPLVFFDSLIDPRAIGFGDCPFSVMVTQNKKTLTTGEQRYFCPSIPCQSQQSSLPQRTTSSPTLRTPTQSPTIGTSFALGQQWPGLNSRDYTIMQDNCKNNLLTPQNVQTQTDCTHLFSLQTNPQDAYLACVGQALTSSITSTLTTSLEGVPSGNQCGKFSVADTTITPELRTKIDQIKKDIPDPVKLAHIAETAKADGQKSMAFVFATAALETAKEQGKTWGGEQVTIKSKPSETGTQTPPTQPTPQKEEKKKEDTGGWRDAGASAKDCADPAICDSRCTALSRQISKTSKCTEKFLQQATTTLGKSSRVVPQDPRIDPRTINPNPQTEIPQTSDTGGCFPQNTISNSGPQGTANICGLITCASTAQNIDNCCGLDSSFTTRNLLSSTCVGIRCPDGESVLGSNGQCICRTEGTYTAPPSSPGGFGGGDPVGRRFP